MAAQMVLGCKMGRKQDRLWQGKITGRTVAELLDELLGGEDPAEAFCNERPAGRSPGGGRRASAC